ncbi:hypothetical protein F5878DRAFT_672230, partial [Lentinula raphanica]
GTEDGEDGDDDDDDDDDATHDDVTHSPSDNNTNSNRRRVSYTLPAWLQSEFEHCVQTSGPDNRKHDNRPPLYRDCESFYFPRPAKFFILTRNQRVPTPVHLYDYSFFLWDPECLLPTGIPCPNCHTKLHRHGNCKRPRRYFANALRVSQLQRYDELQLQYLYYMWESRSITSLLGHTIELFPPFQDRSARGFAGFIPSAQWLRDTYDDFIAIHVQDMNQHTAMLTADIIAIDHIAKINGVQVFVGLLTMTNEKGEIRLCDLVASKSHSQFEIALRKLSESLAMYGHSQPSICYTDNMADQPFMEQVLPSLREGVNPVENHSHLDPLTIPSDVTIIYPLQTSSQVDDAMRSILQLLAACLTTMMVVVWSLGLMLSITLMFLRADMLLAEVKLQYCRSHASSSPAGTFVGAIDLAKLAKERLVIKRATMGLADLCACTLGKRLNKNVAEPQIEYAALDAYASLRIYEQLMLIPVPSPLSSNATPNPGDPILLFGDDKSRLIARGRISEHYKPRSAYDNINITELRCVIEVTDVYVPGAVLSTHHKRSLESFGSVPFHVVCLKSHLRIPHDKIAESIKPPVSTLSQIRPATTVPGIDDGLTATEQAPDGNIGMLLLDSIDSSDHEPLTSRSLESFALDPKSKADGDEVFKTIAQMTWAPDMRSRVKKDVFHVFDMFYISTSHGLRVDFSRALRDAIFIPDAGDRHRITTWASSQNPPLTWEYLVRTRPKWVWTHCKRTIPPPEQLYRLVELVFRTYGPLKDVKTGSPLFNTAAWSVSRNILELIRKGYLSDPPGLALYTQVGIDSKADGLPIYRCFRGTNFTEGGVHCHLVEHLPKHGVSVRHVHSCLQDFVLSHNLRVGTFNSTGQPWKSHYSIWLTNELHEMLLTLRSNNLIPEIPNGIIPAGWVNGNFYLPTTEVTGILPIPEKIRHLVLTNTGSSEPRWDNIVLAWNTVANNEKEVSYKIIEHLRLYYNGEWKSLANIKQTLAQTADDRKRAKKHIHDPLRTKPLPVAPEAPLSLHHVPAGLRSLESTPLPHPNPLTPPTITQTDAEDLHRQPLQPEPNSNPIAASASSSSSSSQDPPPCSVSTVIEQLAGNRVHANATLPAPRPKQRQVRRCKKCTRGELCNGRSNVKLCMNPCRDCGKVECEGRDSKRLNSPCKNVS